MTRQEIVSRAALLLREHLATAGASDPFTLSAFCDDIADEIASRTDCLFSYVTTDLIANEASYCLPNLKKVLAVFVVDSSGKTRPIQPTTRQGLTDTVGAYWWKNGLASDPPTNAAFEGGNGVLLFPTPSVARSGALTMEGYCIPRGMWSNDTDACPLPLWAHQAVVYGVAMLRAQQLVGEMGGAEQKAAWFERRYKSLRGDVEQMSSQYAPRESAVYPGWYF